MELTWFRRPAAARPGTLNLCFNALDRHVVAGHADDVAVVTPHGSVTRAQLLEQVAILAGALQILGAGPGHAVRRHLDDPVDDLLVLLACLRIGAVTGDVEDPAVLVTDDPDRRGAPVRLLRGAPPEDEAVDVAWDVALGAGRQSPAPCAALAADAPAYAVDGRVVTVLDAVADPSASGRLLAALCSVGGGERRPVELG